MGSRPLVPPVRFPHWERARRQVLKGVTVKAGGWRPGSPSALPRTVRRVVSARGMAEARMGHGRAVLGHGRPLPRMDEDPCLSGAPSALPGGIRTWWWSRPARAGPPRVTQHFRHLGRLVTPWKGALQGNREPWKSEPPDSPPRGDPGEKSGGRGRTCAQETHLGADSGVQQDKSEGREGQPWSVG